MATPLHRFKSCGYHSRSKREWKKKFKWNVDGKHGVQMCTRYRCMYSYYVGLYVCCGMYYIIQHVQDSIHVPTEIHARYTTQQGKGIVST